MALPAKKTNAVPPPAKTLEGRNDQLIALAYNVAEERLRDGKASAQEIVHLLKQGSPAQILQISKLENENEVLKTRVREMESRVSSEELYADALAAFKGYSGQGPTLEDTANADVYLP